VYLLQNLRFSAILEIYRAKFLRGLCQRSVPVEIVARPITSAPADTKNQFCGCWYIFWTVIYNRKQFHSLARGHTGNGGSQN